MFKFALASDHAGFKMKEKMKFKLSQEGFEFKDFGTYNEDSVDYPDYIKKGALALSCQEYNRGIFFCGSGIGANIVANRFKGVRCVLGNDEYSVKMSRLHNDCNAIAFGARRMDQNDIEKMFMIWLNTKFEGGRHDVRIQKIEF